MDQRPLFIVADGRDDIIALLAYPRKRLGAFVGLEDCTHDGFLDASDPSCGDCRYLPECQWLYSNDEFADLGVKPIEKLIEALDFATELIEAQMMCSDHSSKNCTCESCSWVREARALLKTNDPQMQR